MEQKIAEPRNESHALPILSWTTLWLMLAIAATGYLTGWLTGLSESPVVGILLPLLFTLIAGASGFHFSSGLLGKKPSQDSIGHVARATVLFMVACWTGIHFGIVVRSSSQAATDIALSSSQLSALPSVEIVRLTGIQKKLMLLGVEDDVVRAFGTKYVEEYSNGAKNSFRWRGSQGWGH